MWKKIFNAWFFVTYTTQYDVYTVAGEKSWWVHSNAVEESSLVTICAAGHFSLRGFKARMSLPIKTAHASGEDTIGPSSIPFARAVLGLEWAEWLKNCWHGRLLKWSWHKFQPTYQCKVSSCGSKHPISWWGPCRCPKTPHQLQIRKCHPRPLGPLFLLHFLRIL